MESSNQIKQGLQFPDLFIPPELFPILIRWHEHPEIKGGIVMLPYERQMVLTQSCDKPNFCFWGIKTGVHKVRSNYWHLPDLKRMRRETELKTEFEFSWHSRIQRYDDEYVKFTHRYQTIVDSLGNHYQVSENVGFDMVKNLPVLV